jgi:hypothetical protein
MPHQRLVSPRARVQNALEHTIRERASAMTMTPGIRKFALTAHVSCSVGLLGSIAAFLVLAFAGLFGQESQVIRAAYVAMDLIARILIVPLAFVSLFSGIVQSLGTPWGLFRHYWILAKLLLTAFATTVLLVKLELIGRAAHLAAETILRRSDLYAIGTELAVHAAGGLVVLLVPTVLSVYKPRGLTPYGRRKQQEQGRPPQGVGISPQHSLDIAKGTGLFPTGSSITFTLGYTQGFGIAAGLLVLHILIFHLAGFGFGH